MGCADHPTSHFVLFIENHQTEKMGMHQTLCPPTNKQQEIIDSQNIFDRNAE
jgi:hypothetical protein